MNCLWKCVPAALLLLGGCEPERVVAHSRPVAEAMAIATPEPPPVEPAATEPNNDCWWFQPTDDNLIAVWVSPRLPGQVPGGFRFVNLFLHYPGPTPDIVLHSSPVHSNRRDAVGTSNEGRTFRVEPVAGKTWSQVVKRTDLDVMIEMP